MIFGLLIRVFLVVFLVVFTVGMAVAEPLVGIV